MARQGRLIEPINNATMEDLARAILRAKKKPASDKTPPTSEREDTPHEEETSDE